MMTEIMRKLPVELKLKILGYKQSPPHFIAMKTGLFPIRDSMLKIIEEPTISLHEEEDEDDLDSEWLMFQLEMEDEEATLLNLPYYYFEMGLPIP
tara:strand:+ start:183 stop:467 length:285 start_codon:yes stop_codon:yes gene_type:complete